MEETKRGLGARALSVLTAAALAFGMMPSMAWAAEGATGNSAAEAAQPSAQQPVTLSVGEGGYETDISKSTTIAVSGTEGNSYLGVPLDPIVMSDSANENSDYFTKSLVRDDSGYGSFDYVVEYADNTNAGTAKWTIIGGRDAGGAEWQADYVGTLSGTFEIAKGDLGAAAVSLVGDKGGVYFGDGTQAVTPAVKVSLGTVRQLVNWEWQDVTVFLPESDYSVVYRDAAGNVVAEPKAAGDYTVEVVAASGNVTGTSGRVPFSITDKAIDLSAATFSHVETDEFYNTEVKDGIQDQVFSPAGVEPEFIVTLGGTELVKGEDYVVSFSGNDKVGTATATVAGVGLYTGSASATFAVTPADITGNGEADWTGNGCAVLLGGQLGQNNTVPYTGVAHDFPVRVTFGCGYAWDSTGVTGELVAGVDYDVTYANTTDVWLAGNLYSGEDREELYPAEKQPTITVTGKGNYAGVAKKTFSIVPRVDLGTANISGMPSLSFDGRAHALTPSDAERKYVNLHNGGCAYGLEGGEGVLYETTYRDAAGNEVAAGDVRDAGEYVMVITGLESGGFTGSNEVKFAIEPADFARVEIGEIPDQVGWSAECAPVPEMTCTFGEGDEAVAYQLTANDFAISYEGDGLEGSGSARARITPKGNFAGAARFVKFNVVEAPEPGPVTPPEPAKVDLSGAKVAVSAATYNGGKAVTPKVTVTLGGKTLRKGVDYQVRFSNNKKAGKGAVVVTGMGAYAGVAKAAFTIGKAANPMKVSGKTAVVKASAAKKKAQVLKRAAVLVVKGAQGAVKFAKTSGDKRIAVAKNGVVTVKKGTPRGTYVVKVSATAAGNGNYKGVTRKNVKFIVKVK